MASIHEQCDLRPINRNIVSTIWKKHLCRMDNCKWWQILWKCKKTLSSTWIAQFLPVLLGIQLANENTSSKRQRVHVLWCHSVHSPLHHQLGTHCLSVASSLEHKRARRKCMKWGKSRRKGMSRKMYMLAVRTWMTGTPRSFRSWRQSLVRDDAAWCKRDLAFK